MWWREDAASSGIVGVASRKILGVVSRCGGSMLQGVAGQREKESHAPHPAGRPTQPCPALPCLAGAQLNYWL